MFSERAFNKSVVILRFRFDTTNHMICFQICDVLINIFISRYVIFIFFSTLELMLHIE
ncbi:hypothetical protein HanIR_Chr16g0827121 [Helianthus annuus]|nr:hypothetical protein HanIR_Chr16g0827121 [Helianthus annuus]